MYIVRETEEFRDWLDALDDKVARIRIAARLRYAEAGNLGDWAPVSGDVSELRIDVGPGYRLYFCRRGRVLVAILCGGTKSTQKRDIRKAVRISTEIGEDV